MASNDGNVVATRSAHEDGGSTFATNRFVVRAIVPYWDVARYMPLYPSTLDARRFEAMFSNG